jgi:hypothetical protein
VGKTLFAFSIRTIVKIRAAPATVVSEAIGEAQMVSSRVFQLPAFFGVLLRVAGEGVF